MTDQQFLEGVLGGILGAGRAVFNGLFQVFTVLVLTLYFLSSLPRVKHGAYADGSGHPPHPGRVAVRGDHAAHRVLRDRPGRHRHAQRRAVLRHDDIVGIPYAAVLAVTVGFLGLIPMVGATLGAAVVCIVAFFVDPSKALIAADLLPRLAADRELPRGAARSCSTRCRCPVR